MTNCKFIFSSDIHGNKIHLKKLFEYAIKNKISYIVLGGDICPKDVSHRTIVDQKNFLKFLISYKNKYKNINLYLILGNDDFYTNDKILKNNDKLKYMNLKKTKFFESFFIFGFSYVAPTSFRFKDWELWDTKNKKYDSLRGKFVTVGVKSKNDRLLHFDMKNLRRENNIYSLLIKKTKNLDLKKTIFVIHTPPFNTKIDLCKTKEHVGSIGVRKFIEEKKPILTLHGHIHEAFEMSSTYYDKIGNAVVINACNDYLSNEVSFILINIKDARIEHKRIII